MKMKKIFTLALAGTMTLSMTACGAGKEYETILDNFFEAIEEADGELYMDLVHPIILENEREQYNLTESKQKEMYQSVVDMLYNALEEEYGDDFKFSYKIEDDEELEKDDLEDWEEQLCDTWGKDELDVSKGYEVEVEIKFKADGKKESDTANFTFLEVEDEWCIVESDM